MLEEKRVSFRPMNENDLVLKLPEHELHEGKKEDCVLMEWRA